MCHNRSAKQPRPLPLEIDLTLLVGTAGNTRASISSMSIPALRPYLKNFVMAGWTQHSIPDNFIDTQLVRVDDNPVAVTPY